MSASALDPIRFELDAWQAAGKRARLWLRDDDAVEPTPALERWISLCRAHHAPLLLAVIPAGAGEALAARLASEPLIHPCQHGYAHQNHALPGERAQELGLQRGMAAALDELQRGRAKLLDLFGKTLRPVLVPPWNRIAPELVPELPGLGFEALSCFGWKDIGSGIRQIHSHVDLIDWKATRRCRDHAWLARETAEALRLSRGSDQRPVGILAHHLVHDAEAWKFLEMLLPLAGGHLAAEWVEV